jgi:hypothetical protein
MEMFIKFNHDNENAHQNMEVQNGMQHKVSTFSKRYQNRTGYIQSNQLNQGKNPTMVKVNPNCLQRTKQAVVRHPMFMIPINTLPHAIG